jgi:hypothetical protein
VSDNRPRGGNSSGVSGIARHGRLKKSGPVGALFGIIGTILAVIVVSSLVITGLVLWQFQSNIGPSVNIHPHESIAPPPGIGVYPGGFNVLIVGDDTRDGQGGIGAGKDDGGALNDVTILLHVSADHKFATAVSFPRDMVVPHPRCSKGGTAAGLPINTALSYGGLSCVVTVVEGLTGVPIQFAGLITFTPREPTTSTVALRSRSFAPAMAWAMAATSVESARSRSTSPHWFASSRMLARWAIR